MSKEYINDECENRFRGRGVRRRKEQIVPSVADETLWEKRVLGSSVSDNSARRLYNRFIKDRVDIREYTHADISVEIDPKDNSKLVNNIESDVLSDISGSGVRLRTDLSGSGSNFKCDSPSFPRSHGGSNRLY